jgi:hypothetical protein
MMIGILAFATPTANAEIYNCGTLGAFFAGWKAADSGEPHSYEGTRGDLIYQQGTQCHTDTSPNNLTASWTMILSQDRQGYAQSGYIYDNLPPYCWKNFAEQKIGSGYLSVRKYGSCIDPGTHHNTGQETMPVAPPQYWAIRSYIDSTVLMFSNWNQFATWTTPFVPEFLGETHYDQSDVPGGPSSKTEWGGNLAYHGGSRICR